MELIAYYAGFTFPIALLVFVGSYFGIWKKTEARLPAGEVAALFFFLWVVTALLMLGFRLALGGQGAAAVDLWGPLVAGVIIGRSLVDWRRRTHADLGHGAA